MSDVLEIARIGLSSLQARVSGSAANAANALTPGYRRKVAAPAPQFHVAMRDAAATTATAPAHPEFARDASAGSMRATGRTADVAIPTPNVFFLLSDGARQFVTRAGNFRTDAENRLVAFNGLRVQGEQGDIVLPPGRIEIDERARISVEGIPVASLALVTPESPETLDFADAGVIAPTTRWHAAGLDAMRVRPGHLEESNVDHGAEMLALMANVRQYESLVRASQGYDDMLSRAIQKLGDLQG
ncbi:flagellar hook basal-body protein [Niveibacterium sp. COAC-50]|uniref:flagellar hook basal-body protein n=1 Tax=Niveibacterium sp. COAC-50 TaxID=2729384 RepID=UPI0015578460|nr:flagellar hook basal-body protein [Niveibacterium sp. COAC-50]